jgi:hypothetical protein
MKKILLITISMFLSVNIFAATNTSKDIILLGTKKIGFGRFQFAYKETGSTGAGFYENIVVKDNYNDNIKYFEIQTPQVNEYYQDVLKPLSKDKVTEIINEKRKEVNEYLNANKFSVIEFKKLKKDEKNRFVIPKIGNLYIETEHGGDLVKVYYEDTKQKNLLDAIFHNLYSNYGKYGLSVNNILDTVYYREYTDSHFKRYEFIFILKWNYSINGDHKNCLIKSVFVSYDRK